MTPATIKQCCATAYESQFARLLLGDSFHPGGLALTRRLAEILELREGTRVLDVASGKGESAILLAKEFRCQMTGLDLSSENVRAAEQRAIEAGVEGLTRFLQGDAESVGLGDRTFDCVICECAFCTFPNKNAAAQEFARVLVPGGRLGLSDLTRADELPNELRGVLAWVACIADARPVADYVSCLTDAGFRTTAIEPHDGALVQMAREIQGRLLGLKLMAGLGKLDLAGMDLPQASQFAEAAVRGIQEGKLGYALIVAESKRGAS